MAAGRHRLASERLAGIGRNRYRVARRRQYDEPVAAQNRTGPSHRVLLFLLVLIAGKLAHPADLALVAGEAYQLVVVRQHINIVARDPRAMSAAEVFLPRALPGPQIDCRKPAAMARGEDPAAIEDGPPADVGQARNGVYAA